MEGDTPFNAGLSTPTHLLAMSDFLGVIRLFATHQSIHWILDKEKKMIDGWIIFAWQRCVVLYGCLFKDSSHTTFAFFPFLSFTMHTHTHTNAATACVFHTDTVDLHTCGELLVLFPPRKLTTFQTHALTLRGSRFNKIISNVPIMKIHWINKLPGAGREK